MELELTPEQEMFVRHAVESGRLGSEQDALREALSLWEERERTRAEILAGVEAAELSPGRWINEPAMRDLAAAVKQRGRARLAAEQSPVR